MSTLDGIVLDLDETTYHAHPALSSTGARKLLDSPARFRHYMDHPQPGKPAFDLGHAAHAKVLGVGSPVVEYPAELLTPSGNVSTSKAAVEWATSMRMAGLTPVSTSDIRAVEGMAEAVLAHPEAKRLFEQDGNAEASLFATDPDTGVPMRARFDFLPTFMQDNPCAVDVKTTGKSAAPEEFAKTVASFGYHIQDDFYRHVYSIVTGVSGLPMKFVVAETTAPYLVGVYQLSLEYMEIAAKQVRAALNMYAACTADNVWPGYPTMNDPLQPPNWLIYQEGMEL